MQKRENPWRHLALLICILLLFTVSPFVVTFRHGILVLNIIGAAVLIAGSYALSERRHLYPIAIALSALSIIATWVLLIFPRHLARYSSLMHRSLFSSRFSA